MSTEQQKKGAWRDLLPKWAEHLVKVYRADRYRPRKKAPSSRDRHRMEVAARKRSHPNKRASNFEKLFVRKAEHLNQK